MAGRSGTRTAAGGLRVLVDAYEQVQRLRLQTGERLRAVLQGRDGSPPRGPALPDQPADTLQRIRRGECDGPVPFLGRLYRRLHEEERALLAALETELAGHPAWPWLGRVRGIGPSLAGRLLARLDVERAATPSSFWAYCGLATVPGRAYRCDPCGLRASFPEGYRVTGGHQALGRRGPCPGTLRDTGDPDARVAQPRAPRGAGRDYNPGAKAACYLAGVSFLKAGGPYADRYRAERARLDAERPGWTGKRKHLGALRKTEKLFLSHLWRVWREAAELPVVPPYIHAAHPDAAYLDPWTMAGPGERGRA
ncbi:MAG TPA: hypothetical protein VHG51_10230 [Longimicrobiaceae bacterium]|nr:hypothetical protein [Longimicrobiaceae bacterium]